MKELHSQEVRKLAPENDPLKIGMGWTVEDLEKYYDMEGHMYEDGANEFSRILGEYLSLSRNM